MGIGEGPTHSSFAAGKTKKKKVEYASSSALSDPFFTDSPKKKIQLADGWEGGSGSGKVHPEGDHGSEMSLGSYSADSDLLSNSHRLLPPL